MKTVIVVDDDKDLVESISQLLSLMDIDVIATAFDGKDAVEKYDEYNPDIMLIDVAMPNYDGFYALENIRSDHPKSNIIMLTGDPTSETRDRLEKMKPTLILNKPVNSKELLSLFN